MSIQEFINVFHHITNEFRILNEHFDAKTRSNTSDFDMVFSNWTRDMSHRYKEFSLNMHWAMSSNHISRNQILFDVRYKDEYFCEIKYSFDPVFIKNFPETLKNFLDVFQEVVIEFEKFVEKFPLDHQSVIADFEKVFLDWKKSIGERTQGILLDVHWTNKLEKLTMNPVLFTLMIRDEYLCEVKRKFVNEEELKRFAASNLEDIGI